MVKYCCDQCGKCFTQKSHYNAHEKRKTPCVNTVAETVTETLTKSIPNKGLKEIPEQLQKLHLCLQGVVV